jgi:hypothetical protein
MIRVKILNRDDSVAAEFLTEGDGYFTYLGLAPGHYRAVIDPEQLEKLDFKANPAEIPFNIEVDKYGDIVDTLEFVIEPNSPTKISQDATPQSPIKETEEPQVPQKALRIDLGERGYWAFSDTDENIKLIQQFLKELGYESGKIDGIYGEKTLRAVREFQKVAGIRLDGIFGPETLGTLEDRMSEKE